MTNSTVYSLDDIAKESGGFAKWEIPGTRYTGCISNPRWIDNQFKDEGGPEKHFAFDLEDEGVVVTVKLDKAGLRTALREAAKAVGVDGIKAGDYVEFEYTGDGEVTKAGLNAPKLFSCVYQPADTAWTGA